MLHLRDRLKKLWYRWRARQSPFTLDDFYFRDKRLLFRFSKLAYRCGLTANLVTACGWALLFLWFVFGEFYYKERYFWLDFWFITLVSSTDFIDGPLARNNDDVTIQGTLGDYFRDFFFTIYMSFAALAYALPVFFFWTVVGLELSVLLIKFVAFVWYGAGPFWRYKFLEFAMDNFQGSWKDRVQFGLLCFGIPYLMLGEFKKIFFFVQMGYVFIWLSLGMSLIVVLKELKWSPPSTEEN